MIKTIAKEVYKCRHKAYIDKPMRSELNIMKDILSSPNCIISVLQYLMLYIEIQISSLMEMLVSKQEEDIQKVCFGGI